MAKVMLSVNQDGIHITRDGWNKIWDALQPPTTAEADKDQSKVNSRKVGKDGKVYGCELYDQCIARQSAPAPEEIPDDAKYVELTKEMVNKYRGLFSPCPKGVIVIPKAIKIDEGIVRIDSIGNNAFENVDATRVEVEAPLKHVGYRAFANSTIKSIQFFGSCPIIWHEAFKNCHVLEDIILPHNIEIIGISAFENCTALKNINGICNVKKICDDAFRHCMSLTHIENLDMIHIIGNDAFSYCLDLKSILVNPDKLEYIGFNILHPNRSCMTFNAYGNKYLNIGHYEVPRKGDNNESK